MKKVLFLVLSIFILTNLVYPQDIINETGRDGKFIVRDAEQQEALIIGRLVTAASRITPWQSLCLTQVLVVQRLLASRNIPGQFYLGVRRGCELTDDPTGLSAHAWLQCGEDIVSGRAGHERFTVVSAFSWDSVGVRSRKEARA